jgi:hypothetical protein
MQLDTGFSCNSVIWLTSLPDSELGPTRRMVEDMESLRAEISIGFQHIQVTSNAHLKSLLEELSRHASENGMRPLLHFDMHGNKDNGLYISQSSEYCSWDDLYCSLQVLNQKTGNNLVVIGAACFGLRSIMPIKLDTEVSGFWRAQASVALGEVGISVGFARIWANPLKIPPTPAANPLRKPETSVRY